MTARGRLLFSVRERRDAVHAPETRRERPEAGQPDRVAYLGHRTIGVAQQGRGTFEPARQEVLVWGFAERAVELTAEVRG